MARRIIDLNGKWQFAYTKGGMNAESEIPEGGVFETEMPVPAYWDDCVEYLCETKFWSRGVDFNPAYRRTHLPIGAAKPPDASLPFILGTGWYKKKLRIPNGGGCYVLHMGGAAMEARIWINGRYTAYGGTYAAPIDVEITDFLRRGEENEIVIAVTNTRTDRIGCAIRGYKGKSGGICSDVSLIITDGIFIKDLFVHTKDNKLLWELNLSENNGVTVKWEILDRAADKAIAAGEYIGTGQAAKWETDTFGMREWSDKTPYLYTLKVEIAVGAETVDNIEQLFGLRRAERRGTKVMINDSPVILRGTTDHAYFPETCTVTRDRAYYMRNIRRLKATGFNWMRFHTTIPPEECMEAADMLGMYIQAETQNGFDRDDFVNMIMLCRKHPSVILYCCGNEVPITDDFLKVLEEMADVAHTLAPNCLYDPMEALLRVECLTDKTEEGTEYTGLPHEQLDAYNKPKLERLKEFSDVFAAAVWVFSYDALFGTPEMIDKWLEIYERPVLVHEAGIFDTYLNLDLQMRYEGTRIGTDLYSSLREYMEKKCILKNAPLYYENSCCLMWQISKYALEKARRCQYLSGYDFLGASDCHWHRTGYAVGWFNEFYELKPGFSYEDLRRFNGDSVLLSDVGCDRNVSCGDGINVRLYASLYGGAISKGRVMWRLKGESGRVYDSGEWEVAKLRNGTVAELGEIKTTAPHCVGYGVHLKLEAELTGGEYALTNEWDYWAFDTSDEMPDTVVCDTLDEAAIRYMNGGGRVLLTGKVPFKTLPTRFMSLSGGRTVGNCATVIYDHPITESFPHDGFCDWQFRAMLDNGEAVLFDDDSVPFEPIIEVVSTYKIIRKQAALFEVGVGAGGMVVCTLDLDMTDPGARCLRRAIGAYITSKRFAPRIRMTAEEAAERAGRGETVDVSFETDECYDAAGHVEKINIDMALKM